MEGNRSEIDPPEPHGDGTQELAPGVRVPAGAVRVEFVASSGPGGQNVNKRATKAQLRVAVADLALTPGSRERLATLAGSKLTADGELLISADETRSQKRNERAAFARLREMLVRAMNPPKRRRPTRAPRWAIEKRIREKKQRGEIKKRRRGQD
jgi:ribosome-associated protein